MADKDAPVVDPVDEEWEQVGSTLGNEWDFDKDGPLIGHYLGSEAVELKNPLNDEKGNVRTHATAFRFAHEPDGEIVFLWSSYEVEQAMKVIGPGDKVRVTALGRESFTGDDGPRQIKRYKIERARVA